MQSLKKPQIAADTCNASNDRGKVSLRSTSLKKMDECTPLQSQHTHKRYKYPLFRNLIHTLPPPAPTQPNSSSCTRGNFAYFHYGCDGFMDIGWGCAYRTLQSICSWIVNERNVADGDQTVPSTKEIQETLVRIGDKPRQFVGSHDWIGAIEVFYVIDALYDVPCKIVHIARQEDLKKYVSLLKHYFDKFGGLVMMGGDVDASSKGIAGVHLSGNQAYLLIIDPHFVGVPKSVQELIGCGYIRWQHTSEFADSSFYNLCLPQLQ